MFGLPLAFLNPLMLSGLVLLPALWLLLRVVPPQPRKIDFPPLRLLLDVIPSEETAARSPWWLVLLRLLLAALLIFALAGPVWNPAPAATSGRGPLVLLIDQGWPTAPTWEQRVTTAEQAIAAAEQSDRPVAVVGLGERPGDVSIGTAGAARERLRALVPQPVVDDRQQHLPPIERALASARDADLVWLSDGLETGQSRAFAEALTRLAPGQTLTVLTPDRTARALAGASNDPTALTVRVLRGEGLAGEGGVVRAFDLRGRALGDTVFSFDGAALEAQARFELPIELRNEVARLELTEGRSAGAVQLLDERWRRRSIGLVSGATADTAQPLLAATYYITRALEPFADVRSVAGVSPSAAVRRFVEDGVAVIALADVGTLSPDAREELKTFVQDGGLLLRFAGSRLAASGNDDLVPVRLRRGGRVLGGALAWATPQPLGAYPSGSPFVGLSTPDEVRITRQVLAEPDPDLGNRTWAVLADGTPLVTARREGRGMVVLFHVTGDTTWSNLPLSGLFVDMLRRVVALSGQPPAPGEDTRGGGTVQAQGEVQRAEPVLAPTRTLDGAGAFRAPPPFVKPLPARGTVPASFEHPPGIYGPPDGFRAVNALAGDAKLARIDLNGLPVTLRGYAVSEPTLLAPWLLVAAMLLLLIDSLIVLFLAGSLRRLRRSAVAAGLVLAAGLALSAGHAPPAQAQSAADRAAMAGALQTRLAYVITGDREIDQTSAAGLKGLSMQLASRTAFEPGDPVGVDPSRDELAFYPLIYWAVSPSAAAPSADTLSRIDAYMKRGGTILFDTRDALYGSSPNQPGAQALRRILGGLDVPELEPVAGNHVLTKAFYLLSNFPGRYATGQLWVEALPALGEDEASRPARSGDSVSPIIISSNDLAGAWAVDGRGQPMFPTVPADGRQRELAYRAGINLVIYALTGNYKADQVHVPALLERLGQ